QDRTTERGSQQRRRTRQVCARRSGGGPDGVRAGVTIDHGLELPRARPPVGDTQKLTETIVSVERRPLSTATSPLISKLCRQSDIRKGPGVAARPSFILDPAEPTSASGRRS